MKLLFDENFGMPLVNALRGVLSFCRECPELQHLIELQFGGAQDPEWVPRLKTENWIVLSCDRGRNGGQRLPALCRVYRITHILVSGNLHNSPQFEKARAVIAVWPEIMSLEQADAGSCFSLRYNHARHPVLVRRE